MKKYFYVYNNSKDKLFIVLLEAPKKSLHMNPKYLIRHTSSGEVSIEPEHMINITNKEFVSRLKEVSPSVAKTKSIKLIFESRKVLFYKNNQ